MDEKLKSFLQNYTLKSTEKTKVKVTASVTYSKPLEVEVEVPYTDADLKTAVKEMGILPGDILDDEHQRLRKYIRRMESKDWIVKETLDQLIAERDKHSPWNEDEFEVVEDF